MTDIAFQYIHESNPDIFKEALLYSEAATGFTANLIEKDYYCSLILQYFFNNDTALVFKGGTCLSKIYGEFYRLSEDLDFIIPVATNIKRNKRRTVITPVKIKFLHINKTVPGIKILKDFKGHNESRQYIGHLEYSSAIMDKQEEIRIEIGIREPLLRPSTKSKTQTIVVNPFTRKPLLPVFNVNAMDIKEAYAEKVRAALTREEPAIRDLYDIFHISREAKVNMGDQDFIEMVREKLAVPGNTTVKISSEYIQELNLQLEGQLRPVLRNKDFNKFDLTEAINLLKKVIKGI